MKKTNKTNTVQRGNAFENRVYSKIKKLVESGNFGLDSKRSFVYQKKSYQGKSGCNIVFDISIETFMPDATEYSVLTLIECKDYKNNPIQVDKIRDFSHRISDVGGHKGYFFTTSKFQQGVLSIARQEKVGLAIMDNTDNIDWKIRRIGKQKYQIRQDIEHYISDTESSNTYSFIAISGYCFYLSISDFLSDELGQNIKLSIKVPFITPAKIEKIITDIFKWKNRNDSEYYMNTKELIDFVKNQWSVSFDFDSELYDELGCCDFKEKKISITKTLEYNSPRWRFTLAHEIGHYILHQYLYEKYQIYMANDDEANFRNSELDSNLTRRVEIQANVFASRLLVANEALEIIYCQLHKQLALRNFPMLYIDNQPCNIHNYNYITQKIAKRFGISQDFVRYRLLELKLLELGNT
jgi:Zn-dependent peptidase ImmA (M78 family)